MAEKMERVHRRQEILDAARKCLAQYGFEKMTMDDVGRSVGLNKASLYYYYSSKDALVTDVLTSEAHVFIKELQEKVEAVQGCRNRIQTYLIERFRISQKVVNVHNMSLGSFRRIRPLFRELHQQFREDEVAFLAKILEECRKKKELDTCDASRVAKSIFMLAEAYKLQVVDDPSSPPDSQVDYASVEEDLVYSVSLILGGLGCRS